MRYRRFSQGGDCICATVIFIVSSTIMLKQFMVPGYHNCVIADAYSYTSWAWQFAEQIREGALYPRWMALDFWGYGSPTFILYPPLPFYAVAIVDLFAHSLIISMNIVKSAALFLSALGIYFFCRELLSEKGALVAAIIYMVLPYTILQFYVFGGFASNVSFVWLAPILLFTYRYLKQRKTRHVILAGICYGALILTHLINAYMFTFAFILFVLFVAIVRKSARDVLVLPCVMIVGVMLSAMYIVPLAVEKHLVSLTRFTQLEHGTTYNQYFIVPKLIDRLHPDVVWSAYYNVFVHNLIIFSAIIALALVFTAIHVRTGSVDADNLTWFFLGIALLTMFLLFGVSGFLWESIPFIKYIQYPVRWLNITPFALSSLLALSLFPLQTHPSMRKVRSIVLFILLLGFMYIDYSYIGRACIFPEGELLPAKASNRTMEHLPTGVEISRIDRGGGHTEAAAVVSGTGKADVIKWSAVERMIDTVSGQSLTVRVRTFNFPGWTAYVDGIRTDLKSEEGTGAMLVDVPAGKHRLKLVFRDTPARMAGKIITGATFAALIIFWLKHVLMARRRGGQA